MIIADIRQSYFFVFRAKIVVFRVLVFFKLAGFSDQKNDVTGAFTHFLAFSFNIFQFLLDDSEGCFEY